MRQIYEWRSEYLKQYDKGHIIVIAENAEEAREKVMQSFDAFDEENWSHNYLENDEEDQNDIKSRRELLIQDVEVDPEIKDVCFIVGSS